MTILCTGHLGFIGARLFSKLPNAIGIDVREGKNLLTCQLPEDVDLVYHLAAQSDVQASWLDPLHDLDNVRMTARLAMCYPFAKIVYANSCASVDPQSPYGFSKGVAAEYLHTFHDNVVDCIFPNIYGPGSRSVVDIFKGKEEVTVYGSGLQTRDYVHVDDIVEGLIKAADWQPGTYFMGSGKSTSVLELAEGKKIRYEGARAEAFEVTVPNTTPNWTPLNDVMAYLKA